METPNSLSASPSQSPNDEPKNPTIPCSHQWLPLSCWPHSRTSQTHGHRTFQDPFLPSTSPTLRISRTSHLAFMTHDSDLSCYTPYLRIDCTAALPRRRRRLLRVPTCLPNCYKFMGPKQGSFYRHIISNPFQSSSAKKPPKGEVEKAHDSDND